MGAWIMRAKSVEYTDERRRRRGGEAALVVDDESTVHRRVALDLRQVEGLGDDALTGEGRITMDEDRQPEATGVDLTIRALAIPSTTGRPPRDATVWAPPRQV